MRKNLTFFLGGIFLGGFFTFLINYSQKNLENFFAAQISKPFEEIVVVKQDKKTKNLPLEIDARSVFSLKINSRSQEKILYQKNENEILPIASLTKLMSALVVFQDQENYPLSKEIKISPRAANQIDVPEYGNLKAGEVKKVEDLLKLMLAFSSNDATFALAEEIGIDNFVKKMNEMASELGLKNTHFSNPTGLDPENLKWQPEENKDLFNFSTAKDLIGLGKYILKEFPIIFEFSNQKLSFEILPEQKIIGVKTGYTSEAGGCIFFVFSDEQGNYFLNVILGIKNKEERIRQAQKLIDWINGKI